MTAKKTASKAAAKTEELAEETKKPAKTAKTKAAASDDAKPKRGRKPKAATENKKSAKAKVEEEEEDFNDLETEFEGGEGEAEAEPEVEAEEVSEEKAKAKPLRMKVSRAKERALMREFGLDETALTEEEVAKRRQELKTLIKMGKTRGFLTHQEINDHLPEKLINEEILEAIVSMLNDMGIAVYEQAPDAATLLIQGST